MSKPEAKRVSEREGFLVRRAVPEDADAISSLLREAFAPFEGEYTPEAFAYTTPGVEVILERFNEGTTWVAVDGEEIVGTVSGLPETDRFYVRSMAVKPGFQGGGMGRRLLETLESFARKAEFTTLYLYTTFALPAAKRLYERNGFRTIRDSPQEEFFGTAGLEMEKKLDS